MSCRPKGLTDAGWEPAMSGPKASGWDPLCYDSHCLYLLHPPKRRLYAFEVKDEVMRPFGMITFDEQGTPTPRALPKAEE